MNSTQMKSKITKFGVTTLLIVASSAFAQNGAPTPPATPAAPPAPQKLDLSAEEIANETSFGLGYQNGRRAITDMQQNGLNLDAIDLDAYLAGVKDGLAEKELDPAKINRIEQSFRMLGERLMAEQAAEAKKNEAESKAFLEANKAKEGVVTTDSGLQYTVLKKGEGKVFEAPKDPAQQSNVRFMVHYKGTFADGEVFDSSPNYDETEGRRPVPFNLSVVPGFREALMLMPVGSKWKLFLSPELGYGAEGIPGSIPPNSVLIFELELEDIVDMPMPVQIPDGLGE